MNYLNVHRSKLSLKDFRVAVDKLIDVADITNNAAIRNMFIAVLQKQQLLEFDYGRRSNKKRTR